MPEQTQKTLTRQQLLAISEQATRGKQKAQPEIPDKIG